MKLIKHQIVDGRSRDVKDLLGLDLEKAFDNVLHAFIVQTISDLGIGSRFHSYVSSFLMDRKAKLRIGDFRSEDGPLGGRGTPRGNVISPTLFNICMIGVSERLTRVDDVKHSIYANHITIWCAGGCEGRVEEAMQEAIDVIEEYLCPTGLRCSRAKSELLLYRKEKGGRPKDWKPVSESSIILRTCDAGVIPRVDVIRVLGMFVEFNGGNGAALRKIIAKTDNSSRLVRRIARIHRGMKEASLLSLINAFVLCHFTYTISMHNCLRAERDKLHALIR